MELQGKVHHLGEEQQVTASYNKRELVIKTDEQYPQFILIEFGQGKCNEYLDKLKSNDEVKVSINIRGREWVNPQGETKYFNSISGWKVEKLQSEASPAQLPPVPAAAAFDPASNFTKEEHDDLPF
jgi:translation initiation factor IF-3